MKKEEKPAFDLLLALQNEAIVSGLLAIKERLENIEAIVSKFEEESKKQSYQR